MFSLNLINPNGQINHPVLKFILENEDDCFLDHIIPEVKGFKIEEETENGTLYHITFIPGTWVKLLQAGNNYQLISCS